MKHRLVGLTAMLLVLPVVCLAETNNLTKLPIVRIGIARDGPSIRFPANVDLFKREIVDLTSGEFDVRFPLDKTIHGSWTIAGVKRAVDLLLADPEVDLIVALGPNVSNEVLQRRSFPKPVIAPIVIDAELQGVPLKDGTSGVKNLTYINSFTSFDRDMKAFLEVVRFRRLAVLVGSLALESVPSLRQKVRRVGFEYTIDIEIVPVDTSSEEALDALPPGTDAVYVTPLLRFTPTEFEKLVSGLIERNLPSFSMWGRDEVETGILAGVAPRSDFQRLARRVALDVQSILLGEDAGLLEVAFPRGSELTINMATARAIGVYPPWKVLTEAEPLNEAVEDIERRYTLDSAVREAIAANLDLAA
ncbi:MAG: hypothetical protein JSU72_12500 [Deltaproteobacteria bacterium]|nr:MAG: hypothetical protein JSU72_12500 [Deltaproteobacteria bacterium]